MWSLNNKTVVISGATNGIGKAAAIELSKENPKLLFTYRNQSLADELLAEIKDISPNTQVQSVYCDFSDQDSIKKCTNEINDLCANIDVLINNAGVVNTSYHETGEGIENTFAVNHLGYFLFTNLLLQKLKGHDETRIVNVSSAAHSFVKEIQWEDINFKNNNTLCVEIKKIDVQIECFKRFIKSTIPFFVLGTNPRNLYSFMGIVES